MKYPQYKYLGNTRMPDGKDVLIMSCEQWNTYCFDFNKLNGIEQPPQLVKDMEYYAQESQRKKMYDI